MRWHTVWRRGRWAGALLMLALLLAGCQLVGGSGGPLMRDPDFTGAITEIETGGPQGALGRFLLEGEVTRDGETFVDKYWVTVTGESRLYVREGDAHRQAAFEDVAVGRTASVWFIGPILESFPAQGAAEQVVLLPDAQS